MRYEGNSIQYGAFAIVAIESVWPNPEGNELSPDTTDLSILGEESKPYKTQPRDGFSLTSGVENEEDYANKQGYYKILPLNVIDLQTATSLSGSEFSVTFTLDDLLLVVPSGSEARFRHATGLPMSNNDLIESEFEDQLPQLIEPIGASSSSWEYVKDEDLGLSRYRITGPYSSFNVEDLVDVNDTVTIWIYHDPSDFYIKDGEPITAGDVLLPNDEITNIVGSADRQNQFSVESNNFDETFLFGLGLVNDVVAEAVSLDEEESIGQIAPVDEENIADVLLVLSQEASSGVLPTQAYQKIQDYIEASFPEAGEHEKRYIVQTLAILRRINPETGVPEGGLLSRQAELQADVNSINGVISRVQVDSNGNFVPGSLNEGDRRLLQGLGFDDASLFIVSLNLLKNEINEKSQNYARTYLKRRGSTTATQSFSNGRKVLLNGFHGETPYLALKGVVSSINTNIGTTEGSYTVTLSGSGYEKVLNTNEVFYEDLLYPEATYAPLTDYNTVYMNMSPPRAIHQIISRWAARQVIFGRPTSYSILAFNRNFHIRRAMSEPDEEEPEENVVKFEDGFPNAEGKYPIRGTFIYSEYVGQEDRNDPNFLRVFAPLNYLDTTRIREMSTTLDKAYRDPSVEGAINAAQQLAGRESVMQNLRRVGGVANFYEMFVDETGRFRYRLRFEALERTPNTAYTPIIQDYDILASGTSFSMDDSELVTVVDVSPILTAQVTAFGSLAFIGRSTPRAGKLPLGDVSPIPEESLSPDLHRYGMRTLKIQDLYQSEKGGAKRKAHLYRMFYGKPLKRANVRLRNNTSFRVGETALLCLQNNKKRSRTLIDLERMIDWVDYLLDNREELEMYVGIEHRFLESGAGGDVVPKGGKDSYFFSQGSDFAPMPQTVYDAYNDDPYQFVAKAFKNTFKFLSDILDDVNVITPEYFPSTYWYFDRGVGGFRNWDFGTVQDEEIVSLISAMIRASALGVSEDADKINTLLEKRENQGMINAVKFQNFRATSYYIEGVAHRLAYGAEATTSLTMNFGQDNLVLLEPKYFLPIGFLSLEKRMRIGYNDGELNEGIQAHLWEEPYSEKSAMQKMYLNQFEEDRKFKNASFLHQSQYLRNSSNYMYETIHLHNIVDTTSLHDAPVIEERRTVEPEYVPTQERPGITDELVRRVSRDTVRQISVKDNVVTIIRDDDTEETITLSREEREHALEALSYEDKRAELLSQFTDDSDVIAASTLLMVYEDSVKNAGDNPTIRGAKRFLVETVQAEAGLTTRTGVRTFTNNGQLIISGWGSE